MHLFLNFNKLKISGLVLLILILLSLIYITVIAPIYDYSGFILDINMIRVIGSVFVFAALNFALFNRRISDFIYSILIIILILFTIPSLILFCFGGANYLIFLSHLTFFFTVYTFSIVSKKRVLTNRFSGEKGMKLLLIIAFILFIPFLITYAPHININNFLLLDIHESRMLEREISNTYTSYFYSPLTKIVIPILMIYGIYHKNQICILASGVMLLFLFLVGGHKTVLFTFFIIISLGTRPSFFSQVVSFLQILVIVIVLTMVYYLITDDLTFVALLIRRIFFIPALLDINYFSFFEDNHLYWSASILKSFIDYPYDVTPPFLIGIEFFRQPLMSANNGIISDGFMNLNFLGVVINCVIVGIYFSYLNNLKIHHRFFGIFFVLVFSLLSGFLTVVMVTHGGFLLLLVAQFFLKDTSDVMGDKN